MDKKAFQETFSTVRASNSLRLEVMNMTTKKRSILPKILIAAAIIALLCTTALASQAIIRSFTHGDLVEGGSENLGTFPPQHGSRDTYELYLDFEGNQDAPEHIETFYMIAPEAGYTLREGHTDTWYYDEEPTGPSDFAVYRWQQGDDRRIIFQQSVTGRHDSDVPWDVVYTEDGQEPQVTETALGGVEGYLIEQYREYHYRVFLWTNGDYMFRLEVPGDCTDEQIGDLIESMTAVDDVSPYIIAS